MQKFGIFLAVLVCVACGGVGAQEPSNSAILGVWVAYNNDTPMTGRGLNFDEKGSVLMSRLRYPSTNSAQAEIHFGAYSMTSTELTLTENKSTCLNSAKESLRVKYTLSAESLSVSFPEGPLNFKRDNSTSSPEFTMAFGCFDNNGGFTEGPLLTLP